MKIRKIRKQNVERYARQFKRLRRMSPRGSKLTLISYRGRYHRIWGASIAWPDDFLPTFTECRKALASVRGEDA